MLGLQGIYRDGVLVFFWWSFDHLEIGGLRYIIAKKRDDP